MDEDLDGLSRERLVHEVRRLRAGIRAHRDASGQELCWHHPDLWKLLPEPLEPRIAVPAWPEFLRGCIRYRQSLDEQLPDAPRTADELGGAIRFVRLHADDGGESHMQPREIALASTEFAPPAAPMEVSPVESASGWRFLRLPAGWVGDWHPTPRRIWIFCLAGEMEFRAGDGAVNPLRRGTAMLLEDVTGRGHFSRVVGDREALLVAVQI